MNRQQQITSSDCSVIIALCELEDELEIEKQCSEEYGSLIWLIDTEEE